MNYRLFTIFAIVAGLISLGDIIAYNYYSFIQQKEAVQFWTKLIPLLLYLSILALYNVFYKVNYYSSLITLGMFLSWLGDLFLSFYLPSQPDTEKYLYIGGSSFLLTRICWTFMFMLRPETFIVVRYPVERVIASLSLSTGLFTGFGLFFYFSTPHHLLGALVLVYFMIGFGPLLALAYLRVGRLNQELTKASALALAGILAFNCSDTILFFSLLGEYIPLKWSFLSNNIYWIGMYLLTLSVARKNIVIDWYQENDY